MPGGKGKITGSDGNTFSSENQPAHRGRKPKVFSELAAEYKERGIEKATPEAVKEAFEYLFALPDDEIQGISNGIKPDYPVLIVICAKQMTDKRTMGKVLETMLDRAHGKPKQAMEHTGKDGETLIPQQTTVLEIKYRGENGPIELTSSKQPKETPKGE